MQRRPRRPRLALEVMPHTFEHVESRDYLVARHQGEVSASELRAAREEAIKLVSESGVKRLLIDFSAASSIPDMGESYFLIQDAAANRVWGARTAVIARIDQLRIVEFIAVAAANAGLNVRAFDNEAEALQWLCDPE